MNRHRVLKTALASSFLAAVASQSLAQQDLPPAVKKIQPAVVTVTAYDARGGILQQGSGLFVNKEGTIVSSFHLLHGAARVQVKTRSGKTFPLKLVGAEDREADLFGGAVDVPPGALADLQFTGAAAKVEDRVFIVGGPSLLKETYLEGTVKALKDTPGFGRILQIACPAAANLSGSAVVNSQGEVIGVGLLQAVPGSGALFALPAGRLTSLRQNRVPPTNQWGAGARGSWLDTPAGLSFKGLNYIWLDDYSSALLAFDQAVKRNPNHAEAWFLAGYCNGKLGRWQQAVDAFNQVIQINPSHALAYDNLAQAYGKLGRWQDATDTYKQEVKLRPQNVWARLNLGLAYGRIEKFDEEIEACKQAIQIKPDFFAAQYTLGMVYGKLSRWQEAIDAFKQAVQILPTSNEAYDDLAVAYGELGRWQEAVEAYKKAITVKPDDMTALYNMGVAYGNLGRYEDAVQSYKRDLEINPKDTDALDNMGIALGKLSRWPEAVEAFKKVIEIKPDDPDAHDSLGSAYYKLGRYKEAVESIREAVRIKPDSAKSHYDLGISYLALHDKTSALQEYKLLKPLDPEMGAKLLGLIQK